MAKPISFRFRYLFGSHLNIDISIYLDIVRFQLGVLRYCMSCKLAFSYLFTIRSAQLPPEKCDENTTFFDHRPHKKVVREEDCRPPPIAASDDDDDRAASSPPFVLVVFVVFVFVVFVFFFVVSASPSPRPCLAKRYGTSSFDYDRRFVALARAGGGTLPPPPPLLLPLLAGPGRQTACLPSATSDKRPRQYRGGGGRRFGCAVPFCADRAVPPDRARVAISGDSPVLRMRRRRTDDDD